MHSPFDYPGVAWRDVSGSVPKTPQAHGEDDYKRKQRPSAHR
jgi:hypothetical protein